MRGLALLVAAFAMVAAAGCTTTPAEEPGPMVVGGFAPASGDEPGYKEAESLAIDTIYTREPQRSLVESKNAQVQVVAGLNFRFDIKMSGQNRYTVQVYRDLQGKMEVTEFRKTAP
jgi:hypothetical protein